MIKQIETDKEFLQQKSKDIEITSGCEDYMNAVVDNLLATAMHHQRNCLGLAANQIGYVDRIFVMRFGNMFIPVINPQIISRSGGIVSRPESCLSLPGVSKKVRRHKAILAEFSHPNANARVRLKFKNLEARIFQHEMDHLEGRLI